MLIEIVIGAVVEAVMAIAVNAMVIAVVRRVRRRKRRRKRRTGRPSGRLLFLRATTTTMRADSAGVASTLIGRCLSRSCLAETNNTSLMRRPHVHCRHFHFNLHRNYRSATAGSTAPPGAGPLVANAVAVGRHSLFSGYDLVHREKRSARRTGQ